MEEEREGERERGRVSRRVSERGRVSRREGCQDRSMVKRRGRASGRGGG